MATKKDYTFLAIMGIAAGYLVYDTFIKKHDPQPDNNNQKPPPAVSPSAPTPIQKQPVLPVYSYPIVFGKYHPDMKKLQAIVGVTQDGIYGPKTLAAIQKYVPSVPYLDSADTLNNLGYQIVDIQNGFGFDPYNF